MRYFIYILLATLLISCLSFYSCSEKGTEKMAINTYKSLGDSISMAAQQTLVKNLTSAIQDSGLVYAIDFCHTNAEELILKHSGTDNILAIQRLTDKNRNPQNSLVEEVDKAVFFQMQENSSDTVIVHENHISYYKPIKIAMPTCLKCHGNQSTIAPEALQSILNHYPNDLAQNYEIGDLRGLWKIQLRK